jgi:N-acetylmuramoyl-L-alanine amidase
MARRLLLALLLMGHTGPAVAEVGATGTRVAVAGGPARFYMTYGDVEESELYAPIVAPIQRLGVRFQRRGDDHDVLLDGKTAATWPIVTSREDVPDTGEHPCVLMMGGSTFVPVRALGQLLKARIGWNPKENIVTFTPPAPAEPPPGAPAEGAATLTGVEIVEAAGGVRIRVRGSGSIRARWVPLQHLSPPRIALDFPNARWAEGIALPPASGDVAGLRMGTPQPGLARLAIDLRSPTPKLTALDARGDTVEATVGEGVQIAKALDAEAVVRGLERRLKDRKQKPFRGAIAREIGETAEAPEIDLNPEPVRPGRLKVRPALSLAGRTICLDAGHGGSDPGAHGVANNESVLCLEMILELKAALERLGARTVLTREGDVRLQPAERIAAVHASGAEICISIHCNSMPRPNLASGSETYFRTEQSARLAAALHPRVVAAVKGRDGGIRRHRNFYMVAQPRMPSVLLEIGYINHEGDEALLADPGFRTRLAASLAKGVLDFFGTDVD